jgi:hypothetical protein
MGNPYRKFSTKYKNGTHKQQLHRKRDLWTKRVCNGRTLSILHPRETTASAERTLGVTLHVLRFTSTPKPDPFFFLVFLTIFANNNKWGTTTLVNFSCRSTTLTWPNAIKASSTSLRNTFSYTFLALSYVVIWVSALSPLVWVVRIVSWGKCLECVAINN